MENNKYCLVLEGGGVKCAYQVGSLMALKEKGYEFTSISGASFGALNGALYLMGGVNKLYEFYINLDPIDILGSQDAYDIINNHQGDHASLLTKLIELIKYRGDLIENRNKATLTYQSTIRNALNEFDIKNSEINYYCSVLEINNNQLAVASLNASLLKKDSPTLKWLFQSNLIRGKYISKDSDHLLDYIIASANYPLFSPYQIKDYLYYDGGIFDNVPYKVFTPNPNNKIIIIRTNRGELEGISKENPNILIIEPKEDLGSTVKFNKENILHLIQKGYNETKEYLLNIK